MSVSKSWREMPRRYRLEAGKCKKCGKINFPARLICPECKHREFDTIRLTPEGKILTYTIIYVGPGRFADEVPYAIGIVQLKDKVNIMCQIADCELSRLKTGMPVRIEFRRISEEGEAGVINYGYKCVPA